MAAAADAIEYTTIYTFSDIHGDINNLIINLRDNAKVIRKTGSFNQAVYDADLKTQMNYYIDDDQLTPDLNYQWIPERKNVLIVIVGDTIDGGRQNSYTDPSDPKKIYGEYPFEEIKIFEFLLAIKDQAKQNNSNIEVLYGNHELMNLLGENTYASKYANNTGFYNGLGGIISRKQYFELSKNDDSSDSEDEEFNMGVRLFLQLDMKLIFVYKSYVFVHGGILDKINLSKTDFDISNYQKLNDNFNNILLTGNLIRLCLFYKKDTDIYNVLWTRVYSDLSSRTLLNDVYDASVLCNELNRSLYGFSNGKLDVSILTLVVGHCTNYQYYIVNLYPTCTFKKLISGDGITEEYGYSGDVSQDCGKFANSDDKKYENYKSTFEFCSKASQQDKKIRLIRVDNASSRAFYYNYIHERIISRVELAKHIRNYLGPRLPQLVKIVIDPAGDIITNISSSLQNKLIHAPLDYPPDLVDEINALYPPNR